VSGVEQVAPGRLNAALSDAAVHVYQHHLGRGPTRVQAFFRHDVVVVMVRDAMTRGERTLVEDGQASAARDLRRGLLEAMRDDLAGAVAALTGLGVLAVLADARAAPDVAVHVFVLDGQVAPGKARI
jgi:uncharacterized protein YbcI